MKYDLRDVSLNLKSLSRFCVPGGCHYFRAWKLCGGGMAQEHAFEGYIQSLVPLSLCLLSQGEQTLPQGPVISMFCLTMDPESMEPRTMDKNVRHCKPKSIPAPPRIYWKYLLAATLPTQHFKPKLVYDKCPSKCLVLGVVWPLYLHDRGGREHPKCKKKKITSLQTAGR